MTERYFWDYESGAVLTEQELYGFFDRFSAIDSDFSRMYSTFEQYVEACCSKNGTLQLLRKGPGQFNSAGGDDVGAISQFLALLEAICSREKPGCDVKIIVDGYMLEAYDHPALMQGLINAISDYYADEISDYYAEEISD